MVMKNEKWKICTPFNSFSPFGNKHQKEKKEKYKHSLYLDEYGHILLLYFGQKQISITSNDQKYASALL
jgi:hypothetical protein